MAESPYLFVYGTLRRAVGHPMHDVIGTAADFVGHATTAGTLYDLGPYPGLWPEPANGAGVRGEVYRIRAGQVQGTLERLDAYEGVRAGEVRGCAYRRELLAVTLGEQTLHAWGYVLNQLPDGAIPVAHGDYVSWLAGR